MTNSTGGKEIGFKSCDIAFSSCQTLHCVFSHESSIITHTQLDVSFLLASDRPAAAVLSWTQHSRPDRWVRMERGKKGQINRGKGDRNIEREEREQRKDGWKERETWDRNRRWERRAQVTLEGVEKRVTNANSSLSEPSGKWWKGVKGMRSGNRETGIKKA